MTKELKTRPSKKKTAGSRIGSALESFSRRVAEFAGGTWAFGIALSVIVVWGVTGPLFHFSDTWQLVINTGTTIITFLMVFLIQRSQNKDSMALQLKLNEIVAAVGGASNRLIDVECLTETELRMLHTHYKELARMAMKETSLTESHSIEEAEARHKAKTVHRSKQKEPIVT
jgi:low affinity Fe/Cu permease